MVVLKFGGTSVQNSQWINKALEITHKQLDDAPLLISSAMGKTTNALVRSYEKAETGDLQGAFTEIEGIKEHHYTTLKELTSDSLYTKTSEKLESLFANLTAIIKGIGLLKECSDRSRDAILAYGELLSTTIIAARSQELGVNTVWVDSRDLVKTNDVFTSATPLLEQTYKLISAAIVPKKGTLYVAQGFIASNEQGVTTTLGRSGSDFSATIYGAALKAKEVQIWTDVDGIMTTDPRVISSAQSIPEITYDEAAELAYFGAKVVHPATIQPAVKDKIPVRVKNTHNDTAFGTVIGPKAPGQGLRAIAFKNHITMITITSSRMLNAYGFLSRIFRIFDDFQTSVDLVATSEVSVSITIDSDSQLSEITQALSSLGEVKIEKNRSIICLVGPMLWKDSSFLTKCFAALDNISIELITLGSSDINLSIVVDEKDCNLAVERLHNCFFSA